MSHWVVAQLERYYTGAVPGPVLLWSRTLHEPAMSSYDLQHANAYSLRRCSGRLRFGTDRRDHELGHIRSQTSNVVMLFTRVHGHIR
jgi:hypothetical protein